jgi:hypothetical protein
MKPLFNFLALISALFLSSCRENTPEIVVNSDDAVAIYLLDSFSKTTGQKIDESTIQLKSTPLVAYADIVSYDSTKHILKLTDNGKNSIANLTQSGIRMAYAVKAKGTVVYTGYFWSSVMSSSCDWGVMDIVDLPIKNEITVRVGYSGVAVGDNIPDKRNDKRIIDAFKSGNKLIP